MDCETSASASAQDTGASDRAIERIRHRSFSALRLSGSVFGIAHVLYSLALLTSAGSLSGGGLLLLALELAVVALSWRFTERTYRVGTGLYLLSVSVLASVVLWTYGMTIGTGLAFALTCIGSVVFFGMRTAMIAYGWVAANLVAYGAARHLGWDPGPWPGRVLVATPILVRYSLALLGLLGMVLATVSVAVKGLEAATHELGEALDRERAEHAAREAEEAERVRCERTLHAAQRLEMS